MDKKNYSEKITIRNVAERAGVTIGTVSNFINGTASVSEKTAIKVEAAIKELNYVPNAMAKTLRSKKSKIIGVLIPNMNNSFYSMTTSVFADKAYQHGYTVLLSTYEYSLKREIEELKRLESNQIDTLVLFNGSKDEAVISGFMKKGISFVLADRSTDIKDVSYVQFDNKNVMSEIVAMLKAKGYGRIGLFFEPLDLVNIEDRYLGFVEALRENGYPFCSEDIYIKADFCLNNLKNGYEHMKEILTTRRKEELPNAWIASSDLLAIGMIRAMKECGYRVPEDFGIIGFDNIEISGYVHPRLTTVKQDQFLLGEKLWEVVESLITGKKKVMNITLEQQLVKRESC